jgi:GT2 family glycosyltransferase
MSTKKSPPEISLVMISYNTKEITLDTLRSIYKHTKGVDFEIILVEHGSTDGSVEALKKFAKSKVNLKFLDTKKNPGFGAGNNIGSKKAKGKYLLFINSDILFETNVIKRSLDWLKKNPQVGAYTCKLLNKDKTIQATGGYFPNIFRVLIWQLFIDDLPLIRSFFKSIHPHEPQFSLWNRFLNKTSKANKGGPSFYHQSQLPDWVTGAFMIIPKKLFNDLGGFDENIWMYAEELELCYRLKEKGFKVAYQKTPSLIHLGGASSGGSFLGITQEVKNLIYFFKKHKPRWQLPLIRSIFIIGSLLRFIIFGVLRNHETSRKAYLQAIKLSL